MQRKDVWQWQSMSLMPVAMGFQAYHTTKVNDLRFVIVFYAFMGCASGAKLRLSVHAWRPQVATDAT
jgi:hypothetical protein